MESTTQNPVSSGTFAETSASAVANDPVTAALLAKRAAGEKLTPSEYGKLGQFAKRVKALFGKGDDDVKPDKSRPGESNGLESIPPDEASADSLEPPLIDANLVRSTTESIINFTETIARRKIQRAGEEAGADAKRLARLDSAVRVQAPQRQLMLDTSPAVAEALGISPQTFPIATFIGAAGMWATAIWMALDELKEMKEKKEPKKIEGEEEPKPHPIFLPEAKKTNGTN